MSLVTAVRDYINRMLQDISGMKVLILDSHTVPPHSSNPSPVWVLRNLRKMMWKIWVLEYHLLGLFGNEEFYCNLLVIREFYKAYLNRGFEIRVPNSLPIIYQKIEQRILACQLSGWFFHSVVSVKNLNFRGEKRSFGPFLNIPLRWIWKCFIVLCVRARACVLIRLQIKWAITGTSGSQPHENVGETMELRW